MEDLVSNGSYTIAMDHKIAALSGTGGNGDETLKTSEVILTGFQTYYQPDPSLGIDDFELSLLGISIYSSGNSVYLKSENSLFTDLIVYNIFGQLLKKVQFVNKTNGSVEINDYKGVAIVSLNLDGQIYTKKNL